MKTNQTRFPVRRRKFKIIQLFAVYLFFPHILKFMTFKLEVPVFFFIVSPELAKYPVVVIELRKTFFYFIYFLLIGADSRINRTFLYCPT